MTPADRAAISYLRDALDSSLGAATDMAERYARDDLGLSYAEAASAYREELAALNRLLASHDRAMRAVAEMQAMAAERYAWARDARGYLDELRHFGLDDSSAMADTLDAAAQHQLDAAALSLCVRRALGIEDP